MLYFQALHRPPVDRGVVFPAVEHTLSKGGPVSEDLTNRGLISFIGSSERINVSGIKQLVEKGVYVIDDQGYLQFGRNYESP